MYLAGLNMCLVILIMCLAGFSLYLFVLIMCLAGFNMYLAAIKNYLFLSNIDNIISIIDKYKCNMYKQLFIFATTLNILISC